MALTEALLIQNIRGQIGAEQDTGTDTPLFSSGALDSIAMLNLIILVEEQAGIEIRADEVTLENFDTIERIIRFTQARAA